MDPVQKGLFAIMGVAVVVGLGSAIRHYGSRYVARSLADQVLSIRAFDVLGSGVRLIGIRPTGRTNVFAATQWVTFFYLPVVPLARRIVRFLEPATYGARWQVVETSPLDGREIARTYLWGWVLFPLLIIGPFVAGALLGEAGRALKVLLRQHREVASLLEIACTLLGAALIFGGIPWFAVALYRLLKWDQDRKKPR
jgi:hypothetical protein